MAAQTGVAGPEGDTVKARMQVREATTDEDRERIFRFRYEGYWEQQRLLPELCDHERKTLRDADDAVARLFYVERAGTVLGTLRVNWFADGPVSAATRDLFGVAPFERSLGTEQMALLSRFIVAPEERGGACAGLLLLEVARFGIAKRIHHGSFARALVRAVPTLRSEKPQPLEPVHLRTGTLNVVSVGTRL